MRIKGSCRCNTVRFACDAYAPVPYLRCYCSICRKTAGGGGYAVNLGAHAGSLAIAGGQGLSVYRARIDGEVSTGERNFCSRCGTFLWLFDPSWPALLHPFASCIDTPLPKPPEVVHIMLRYRAPWVEVPRGKRHRHFDEYPDESLEEWHRRLGLLSQD
jgi:hypothetical protein